MCGLFAEGSKGSDYCRVNIDDWLLNIEGQMEIGAREKVFGPAFQTKDIG